MPLPAPLSAPLHIACFARREAFRLGSGTARFLAIASLAMTAATAPIALAQMAPGTTCIDNTGLTNSEMAACSNGQTPQARETCMTEARNANAEKRAGKLGGDTDLSANALKRCAVFQKAEDQAACRARVLGEQNAQGGVAAGGVLREAETALPAPAPGSLPAKP